VNPSCEDKINCWKLWDSQHATDTWRPVAWVLKKYSKVHNFIWRLSEKVKPQPYFHPCTIYWEMRIFILNVVTLYRYNLQSLFKLYLRISQLNLV
jgi:hypothetical protein